VPDETTPVRNADQIEVERSRESAARLMENLARKLGGNRTVRKAADSAARFVQDPRWNNMAAEIDRTVRRRPGAAILVAVVVGFVVGRLIRSR
jgi:ElaB/YqjD/DUF883 family membrane-anchored ribosome-binding protein